MLFKKKCSNRNHNGDIKKKKLINRGPQGRFNTLPHDKLKTRLKETIHKAFSHRNYGSKFVVLGYNSTYFSNKIQKGKTCYSEEQVVSMLEFLIDNIFVSFGGTPFEQVVGIPMGTNCAPLLADLFLYSYESEFLQKLVKDKKVY